MSRPVSFEVGQRVSYGTLFEPSYADGAAVLLVHGMGSSRASYAPYAATASELGATCLTLDLGGHGESQVDLNDLTIGDHVREVQAACDYLCAQDQVDPNRVGVVAASYGTHPASLLTVERSIDRLLFRAPAIIPDGMEDTLYRDHDVPAFFEFQKSGLNGVDSLDLEKMFASVRALKAFKGHLTVVRSELDEVVSARIGQEYVRAVEDARIEVIARARHDLSNTDKEIFKGIVADWAQGLLLANR